MFEFVTKKKIASFPIQKDQEILNYVVRSEWSDSTYVNWLKTSPPKRYITYRMYNELFEEGYVDYKVLDVGGGITPLTELYVKKLQQYDLCEIFAHDQQYSSFFSGSGRLFESDWYNITVSHEKWDIVIANDLFPNVDQRLQLFLDKFIPCSKKIRVCLTFYDKPRFYQVKRLDAEEILTYLAYNGEMCLSILSQYKDRIKEFDQLKSHLLLPSKELIFSNNRQIVLIEIKGDA